MAAPWVAIQLSQVLHETGTQGIEVDVADQFQKIRLLFTDDGLIAVLKEMPDTAMAEVKGNGMTGEEAAHESGKLCPIGAEQEMQVITHQRPSEAFGLCLFKEPRKTDDERLPVFIVKENIAPFNAPDDHVL